MKFVISTQELNYLVSKCLNVVPQKPTIPILSNLLIEAFNNKLTITATDLTVGIRCSTEIKILEEGAITLPARKFSHLVRELTTVNVEVSTSSGEITELTAGSSRFKLLGMSGTEFPALPALTEAVRFSIAKESLKDMFFRTGFAVSKEDNRYALTGVFLHIDHGRATFVGTDGKRLARSFVSIPIDASFQGSYIIPLKAVEEILKNLDGEGDVSVYLMNDKIAIESSSCLLITKLLSGEYPDFNRIIPDSTETTVSLHREELTTLLRQVALFTAEQNQSVRFSFSSGELKLNANTMEIGEGRVSMPVNYHGPLLEIAFSPMYFLDILRHSKRETVTIGVTDSFNPGIIIDEDIDSAPFSNASPLFVLMPMRLHEEGS